MDDPFEGAERVDGFEDLWFAAVPNSHDGGHVVTCTYWIYAAPAHRPVQLLRDLVHADLTPAPHRLGLLTANQTLNRNFWAIL
jgi:hypothetical protein